MKKLVVTLDPEYIPWEPGTPTVRLRRKRNKSLLAVLSVGVAVLACVGLGAFGAIGKQRAATPTPTAAPTLSAAVAPPTATPAPRARVPGKPGVLTIIQGTRALFYPCKNFTISCATIVIASGATDDGPVVDVSDQTGEVEIVCDNQGFALD